jgi:hypothetical protein
MAEWHPHLSEDLQQAAFLEPLAARSRVCGLTRRAPRVSAWRQICGARRHSARRDWLNGEHADQSDGQLLAGDALDRLPSTWKACKAPRRGVPK